MWAPVEDVAKVLQLARAGIGPRAISRLTGVPYGTVRRWASGRVPERARHLLDGSRVCNACGAAEHDFDGLPKQAYSYLLGLYLGDGHLCRSGTGSWTLRIALDERYEWIVVSACDAIEDVRGRRPRPQTQKGKQCVVVACTWRQWACLFPQHGPGRKHHRHIELAAWQRRIVDEAPEPFLRGLIHSDGWRGENRVTVKGRPYSYPRYQFSNRSDDIRRLFTDTCDRLGVEWRPWGRFHVSVARRNSVARLDSFIGPKC